MNPDFIQVLYNKILASCPVDTRNMITHISFADYGSYAVITISAPSKYGDYASYTNYNRQRGSKEIYNYKWVERAIKEASAIYGGNIKYGLS